ncbi:hypothetical protein Tco_1325535 [Tanacetum coccineum]
MWIIASRNGRLIWIYLKIDKSRSSSLSLFCFFNREGKGILDNLEGWLKASDWGVVGWDEVGKWGLRVLVPDLVVIAKVDASGSRVLPLSIVLILKLASDDPLRTSLSSFVSLTVPLLQDVVVLIKPQHGRIIVDALPRHPLNVGFITSEIEEMFMDGNGSSHKSSWYWTYSSIRFQSSSSVSVTPR